MKGFSRWLMGCGGLAATGFTRSLMSTLDYRAAFFDETVDPVHPEFRGPAIFLFWHEYITMLFYLRGHCDIAMLVSRHQDAELLSRAARHMGFQTVRGSTNRGGAQALRELLRKSRNRMNLTITPDGPRGPRRRLAPGPLFLSSKLQIPLVLIGIGYDQPWRVPTWDRFAVPRPGSRARAVVSPPIQIPDRLDRERLDDYRRRLEKLLNCLTEDAETWARMGGGKVGQKPVRRQGIRRHHLRQDQPRHDHPRHDQPRQDQPQPLAPLLFSDPAPREPLPNRRRAA